MGRKRRLKIFDWIVLGALVLLAFLPDPTDVVDFGTPIVEPLMAYIYWRWRTSGKVI